MSGEDPPEGFLSRWSRRKRATAAEPAPTEAVTEPSVEPLREVPEAATPDAVPQPACPIPDLPAIDPASLPPIGELTAESDLAPFLRPGVPPLLRQAALRRMWSLDTSIRDYIGPVEYQWDFNAPGGLPHGFASDLGGEVRKLLAQAIGQRDEEEGAAAEAPPDEAPPADEAPEAPEPLAESPEATTAPRRLPEPAAELSPPLRRRRHGGALPV